MFHSSEITDAQLPDSESLCSVLALPFPVSQQQLLPLSLDNAYHRSTISYTAISTNNVVK